MIMCKQLLRYRFRDLSWRLINHQGKRNLFFWEKFRTYLGGGNVSCWLTGCVASNPITVNNCHGNWWSEKYTTTGRGRWLPARSGTNDCTAHDQTTPEPKVKVSYWHLECQNYVSNRQDRTGNAKKMQAWAYYLEEDDRGKNENSREDVERTW